MSKKLTIEYIRGKFKDRGHILLTTEYINNRQTLECICPNGHKRWISWNRFQKNTKCKMCFSESRRMGINVIRKKFKENGCLLLTTEYKNEKQKLEYICSHGCYNTITWHNWNSHGTRCQCESNLKKPTIEFIKEQFKKEEYILLTTEYLNNTQKLYYICPRGHRHYVTWSNWQQGRRCPCFANRPPITIDIIRDRFKKRDYTLLSTKYINAHSKLKYRCPLGHIGSMSWDNFSHGEDCPTCAKEKNKGSGHWNWKGGISKEPYCQEWTNELKEFIKQRDGYKCMNPCCNSKDPDDLTIHHFRYNKKVCGSEDLITVCRSCNSYANYNREFHEAWYKAIMYRRYQYDY